MRRTFFSVFFLVIFRIALFSQEALEEEALVYEENGEEIEEFEWVFDLEDSELEEDDFDEPVKNKQQEK